MSYSFPIAIGTFWSNIRFRNRPAFELQHATMQSETGGGQVLTSRLGQPRWRATVTTAAGPHDADAQTEAIIDTLLGRDGTFLAYDIRRPYPKADPFGVLVAASTVQVRTKGGDNRSLSLKGLPAGYVLSTGDKISIAYSSASRALLKIVDGVTADGSGNTTEFEVQPFLSSGIAVDDAVTLIKPTARFKILAGSKKSSDGSGNISDGLSFSIYSVPS